MNANVLPCNNVRYNYVFQLYPCLFGLAVIS